MHTATQRRLISICRFSHLPGTVGLQIGQSGGASGGPSRGGLTAVTVGRPSVMRTRDDTAAERPDLPPSEASQTAGCVSRLDGHGLQ